MRTKVADITIDPRGFIELKFIPSSEKFDLEEAKLQYKIATSISKERPYLVLIDTTQAIITPNEEAQKFIAELDDRLAEAFVIKSLGYRLLSKFYIKLSTKNPVRVFKDRESAIAWLLSFKRD